jgi:hypothetical protein
MIPKWTEALPEQFEFYHLGEVKQTMTDQIVDLDRKHIVAFRFYGDTQGVLLILFNEGLDASLYTEMGNIIASRSAQGLGEKDGIGVMITPPSTLKKTVAERLIANSDYCIQRSYHHKLNGEIIPIDVFVVPHSPLGAEGAGHA